MKNFFILIMVILLSTNIINAQNLDSARIYINPGHGGHDSDDRFIPETGFWESEGNLTKGLKLRDILLNYNALVEMSRTQNRTQDDLPLSTIVALANNSFGGVGADFFHSIHSNGFQGTANYTLMLYREAVSNPNAISMCNIMGQDIYEDHRTSTNYVRGDLSFLGFNLGVLNGLTMPGTLSEGSFHDYIPESWRLQNLDYRKHESWSIARSFFEYFAVGTFSFGAIAGLVRDIDQSAGWSSIVSSGANDGKLPVNNATVTLTPESLVYNVGTSNNGFFIFDSLIPGNYNLTFQSSGYYNDTTLSVTVTANQTIFSDKYIVSTIPPIVVSTTPVSGDTTFNGYDDIIINFSRNMNQASVVSTFSLTPTTPGTFVWSSNKGLRFIPDGLQFLTNYSLTIAGTAEDIYGHFLDGDGNGTGGDDFTMTFKTGPTDIFPPIILSHFPAANELDVELKPIINVLYDEELDSSAVVDSLFDLVSATIPRDTIPGIFEHRMINNQSLVSYFPIIDLMPEEIYGTIISPGFSDKFGNVITSSNIFVFTTAAYEYIPTEIDDFEGTSINDWWWQPTGACNTTGVITGLTNRTENYDYLNLTSGSTTSMELNYAWDAAARSWLIREYLSGGPPQSVLFNSGYLLQIYIFGDGSGNKFRFCVDDGIGGSTGTEVSLWYTIDWVGWRLVSWDMTNDPVGTGIGNGVLNGTLRFDSIQLTYEPGASEIGTLYFDDLRIATKNNLMGLPDNDKDNLIPTHYQLFQNYPNPFNPSTTIKYQLPQNSNVTIKVFNMLGQYISTLVNEEKTAGVYEVVFNTDNLAGGVYIYTLETESFRDTKKMILLK